MGKKNIIAAGQGACERPVYDSYGRLSWNPTTMELEKIETQWKDNRATIARHEGEVGVQLSDGLSAWKRTVRRKGFEVLLERAEAGLSQGIAVWHVDRLFRQPRDLERLIELADSGFKVISSHGSRDLSNPDDRFILRIEVAQAAKSSDDKSRRVRRRFQEFRETGRWAGGRPGMGFARRDPQWVAGPGQRDEDRPFVSAEQLGRERKALRDAVVAIARGRSDQEKIAREWNKAGLRSVTGLTFTGLSVRSTVLRPTLAGRIEVGGELIGYLEGDPIVAEQVWLRLRAVYEGRRRGAQPGRVYLATGLLKCGVCGAKLCGRRWLDKKSQVVRGNYYCNAQRRGCGRVWVHLAGVDEELRAWTIARLSDPRFAQAITAARSRANERLAELNAEIAQIDELALKLAERLGRREIGLAAFDQSMGFLTADRDELAAERDGLSSVDTGEAVGAVDAGEVARQWDDAASLDDRRALLVAALGGDELRIMPGAAGGQRVFDPDRIKPFDPKTPYGATETAA